MDKDGRQFGPTLRECGLVGVQVLLQSLSLGSTFWVQVCLVMNDSRSYKTREGFEKYPIPDLNLKWVKIVIGVVENPIPKLLMRFILSQRVN